MEREIGILMERAAGLLHIGVNRLREYADTDPTFPCFAVGNKLITTEEALREWATSRAKLRVGMRRNNSQVMRIVKEKRGRLRYEESN